MNAIPPRPLAADPKAPRGADPEHVRLTIDFDEEPAAAPETPSEIERGEFDQPTSAAGGSNDTPRRAQAESSHAQGRVPAHLAAIEVTLSVEIGCHQIPLRDLLSVEPGQLVPLDRMTAEPVSVLVNGKPFARGEVVAIGERYGVRLTEILDAGAC